MSFMSQEEGEVLDDAVESAGFGEGQVQAHVPHIFSRHILEDPEIL